MANEELMHSLPDGVERAQVSTGPFLVRRYPGSVAVVVLNPILVTCGGSGSREDAEQLAGELNETWRRSFDRQRHLRTEESE